MNPYLNLLNDLKSKLDCDLNTLVYRISMSADLARVQQYGSSRCGLSDKVWDKIDLFIPEQLPYYPIKHEDVVIASELQDLEEDVLQEHGTLKHKIEIYHQPFFTLYHRSAFKQLYKEDIKNLQNQGVHWLFLDNDKKKAIHSLWQITPQFTVSRII